MGDGVIRKGGWGGVKRLVVTRDQDLLLCIKAPKVSFSFAFLPGSLFLLIFNLTCVRFNKGSDTLLPKNQDLLVVEGSSCPCPMYSLESS